MAKFEGVSWAPHQLQYFLEDAQLNMLGFDAKSYSISRSIHYGIFLVFEGIRFYCSKIDGALNLRFLNLESNLTRFHRGMAYCLSPEHQSSLPSTDTLRHILINEFLGSEKLRPFLEEMAAIGAQGYLRPYTIDEDLSIGVTFPSKPAIRVAACRYERYLGEPFDGVVIQNLVRAVSVNKTGSLKLGTNYLISVKAVELAQQLVPTAHAALFLDDRPDKPIEERYVTEWDSSCALFVLNNGTIVKIPEGPLILPSVTIQGMISLASREGFRVEERPVQYKELIKWVQEESLVAICSIGTAGILNRCTRLFLPVGDEMIIHQAQQEHEGYLKLAELKRRYWDLFRNIERPHPNLKTTDVQV